MFGITTAKESTYNQPFTHSKVGTLSDKQLSVTILNRSSSNNPVNITITFPLASLDTTNTSCVWWDQLNLLWSPKGCQTSTTNASSVTCSCKHLTTFSTIHNLNQLQSKNRSPFSFFAESHSWPMLAFAFIFLMIFAYLTLTLLKLKVSANIQLLKHPPTQVSLVAAVAALTQTATCILFIFYSNFKNASLMAPDSLHFLFFAVFYSSCLIVSLLLYQLMFVLVIASWIRVSNAVKQSDRVMLCKRALLALSAATAVAFVGVIILYVTLQDMFLLVARVMWCSVMVLYAVLTPLYGREVYASLTTYMKRQKDVVKISKLLASRRRLALAIACFCVFFVVETGFNVYFMWSGDTDNPYWRFGDLLVHVLCLTAVCGVYQGKLKKLMEPRASTSEAGMSLDKGSCQMQESGVKKKKDSNGKSMQLNEGGKGVTGGQMIKKKKGGAVRNTPNRQALSRVASDSVDDDCTSPGTPASARSVSFKSARSASLKSIKEERPVDKTSHVEKSRRMRLRLAHL